MSETQGNTTRRGLLKAIGGSAALAAGGLPPVLGQELHHDPLQSGPLDKGPDYEPLSLTKHEYATVRLLGDLIVPADEHSPAASAGGAAEFIDFLCSRSDEMREIYTGGLAWLDNYTRAEHGAAFVDAKPEQQTAVLDKIAYKKNAHDPRVAPGVHFFSWMRGMVVDAFYASPSGVKDLGYIGNTAVSEFRVPQEAIDYALKRSGLA